MGDFMNRGKNLGTGFKNRGPVIEGGSFTNRGAEDQSGREFKNRGQAWFGGEFTNRGPRLLESAASWSPSALFASSEVGVWYDPSDLSTMFQDEAGTVPAAVGSAVLRINDKSGNGYHATYTTGPILYEDSGGRPYLHFTGTGSFVTSAIDFTGTAQLGVFAAARKLSDANSMLVELSATTTSNNGSFYVGIDQVAATDWTFAVRGSATSYMNKTGYGQPVTSTLAVLYDLSKTTIQEEVTAYIDGELQTGTAYGAATAGTGNFGNHALYVGSRAVTSNFFIGRLYQLIVRGALSSGDEITSVNNYLDSKVGTFTVAAAVGDSTIAAYLGQNTVLSYVDATPTNVAVAGHTIAQQETAWSALDPAVQQAQLAVIIQVGLNDVDAVEASSVAVARLQSLVDTVLADVSAECKVYISKMLPCKQYWIDSFGETNGLIAQQKWVEMNDAIAGLGPNPITGVDGRITAHVPLLDDGAGSLHADYNIDGIHPNNAGRAIIASAWSEKLVADGLIT